MNGWDIAFWVVVGMLLWKLLAGGIDMFFEWYEMRGLVMSDRDAAEYFAKRDREAAEFRKKLGIKGLTKK